MDKKAAREFVRKRKKQMTVEEIKAKSKKILERLLKEPCFLQAETLYCYVSYNQEVMTKPLISQALAMGKKVAVPKVIGEEMEFIYLNSLDELARGYQGIEEPTGTTVANEDSVLMILPGLAFDEHGNRVGYGGGFYDRYLNRNRMNHYIKVAVGFDFQVVEHLEMEECDELVDIILTEERRLEG